MEGKLLEAIKKLKEWGIEEIMNGKAGIGRTN